MVVGKIKTVALIVGMTVLPGMVVGSLCVASNSFSKLSRADGPTITLDSTNQPELDNAGEGTLVDAKGVTWEYSNAEDNPSGHVTLNAEGYFGVAAGSDYGITGINSVQANFTGTELWLLTSIDGVDWHEGEILTSGTASTVADMWRYVRFYTYSSTVNVSSIVIGYTCSGESSSEDIDGAHVENVITASSNLTYEEETTYFSTADSTKAIRFTKSGTASSNMVISFGKTYTIREIQNKKVEFDYKTSSINYGKTMQLMKNNSTVGSSVDSSKHSCYKVTPLHDDWYHIEVPITAFISTISGYDTQDIPAKNVEDKEINGIKINAGSCTIDNLRIGSNSCELGLYNNGTSFGTGSVYWFKISWVGKLHSCVMTFSNGCASQVPLTDPKLKNGSPFYIYGESAGTVVVTATLVVGYNHRTQTISNTITIN